MTRKKTVVEFTAEFDEEFPMQPEDMWLPWQQFTRDFWSIDLPFDMDLEYLCEKEKTQMLDFRPYMISNPFTVFTTDYLDKCIDIFRKMHLRHIAVIHPRNGSLQGIITR